MFQRIKHTVRVLVIFIFLAYFFYDKGISEESVIQGNASWYSQKDTGVLPTTANMELFDDTQLTCAMWDIPFNTYLKVTNMDNGKSIIVRVNDRGPAKRLVAGGRVIDLSKAAFAQIASLSQGIIPVQVEVIQAAPSG